MTVDTGDGSLNLLVAGDGAAVVMLHGWTLDHRNWRYQLPLADAFRLVMPDRRGFGRSTAAPNVAIEWRDVDQLVADDRFVLVGLSQGASVALDFTRHRPERLAGLVLVGAPLHDVVPHDDEGDIIPRSRFAALIEQGQLAAMKAEWGAHPLVRTNAVGRPLLEAMLESYDGRDLLAEPSVIAITAADIAALPMPVLAIAGEGDTPWRRRVAQFIADTAPHGQMTLIDDAGHLCNLDNPAMFNAIVRNFFTLVHR